MTRSCAVSRKLIDEVRAVLNNNGRSDRYLSRGIGGDLYLTPKIEGSEQFGPLPVIEDDDTDDIEEAAAQIWCANDTLPD